MLFRCIRENYHIIQVNEAIGEVQLWKVGRVLHSPKGILSHSYRPILPRVKAVYCLDSSSIGTCQNPEFMLNVKKWAAPVRLSSVSKDVRQWVGVLDSQRVKISEVKTEAQRPVLLSYKYNSITPWAVAWLDHPSI